MEKPKILVTGAAGYLGNILCPLLREQGYSVLGIDNFLYGQPYQSDVQKGDITSLMDMYKATKGMDVVVALAGIVGDAACGLDKEATRVINQESTRILADVCEVNKIKRLIFASSSSVYGISKAPVDEFGETSPVSLYAETKLASEKILMERCHNCQPIILRFGTLFGYSPRMRFDLVVNIMTAMAIKEKEIIVNGGDQRRPLIHVSDVARVISYFIEGEIKSLVYNVVKNNYTIEQIAKEVNKIIKAKIVKSKEATDTRDYEVLSLFLDVPLKMSLQEGIAEIKKHFDQGEFSDYRDEKYYNVRLLTLEQLKKWD